MSAPGDGDPLAPYVPRLVADWLADEPEVAHRSAVGTFVFADISGFTKLTERLAAGGKSGAEEMGALLNDTFEQLLTAAYDYGANLLKWGGDAVLLLFDGPGHAARGTRAAWGMQQVMRRIGRLQTSRGVVRLGISIGVYTGAVDFLLIGHRHRELVITGPGASATVLMEKLASRGQVVLSGPTAAELPPACVGDDVGGGRLLGRPPEVEPTPNRTPKRDDVDLGRALSAHLRDHLRGGEVEDEHRSVTVGFIRFAGTDELLATQGPAALVDALGYVIDTVQDVAEANGVTFLATDVNEDGGKIILTSGVPLAAGDAETRVLSTLRQVVHPGGRLALSAGITCGSVFAGDYGPFYRKTYSIAGDIVNLCARLMAAAEPGQVVATPTVVARSRTAFDTTPLPPFLVKGKAEPIAAVVIGDRQRADGVATERATLVGRDHELESLLQAAARAAGGAGEIVEIVGEPGMGKSRLIGELVDRTEARTLWADGDIYGRATPYQPMQRMLRNALALPVDVDDVTLSAVLTELVLGAAPDLAHWLPLIGIVAGVDLPPTPEVAQLDPEARRSQLETVTSELLGRLLPTPVIMVLNDTQFMDEATLALSRRLAVDVASRPWLIVISRRPGRESPIAAIEHQILELTPLDADASARLLAQATDAAPLPAHRMQQLVEQAGGNPLFLNQLVGAALAGADLDDLPDSVEGSIAAQIDRLPHRRKRWLRAAAVLGMSFDGSWLGAVLAGTELAGDDGAGLEEFIAVHPDGRHQFAHHLIRLTAYEGLPYRRRTELHARAAHALERRTGRRRADQHNSLLSLHCLRGERYDAAWKYARLAGDHAREQFAAAEAAQCYRRALGAAVHLGQLHPLERAAVYEALADVCIDLGESDEVERSLRQARAAARAEPLTYARLCRKTAGHRQNIGRHATAMSWVVRGRAAIGGRTDPPALSELSLLASHGARIRQAQASYRSALLWNQRAVSEGVRSGDGSALAEARAIRLVLRTQSGQRWDLDDVAETLALIDASGTQRTKAWAANTIGMTAYFAGRWNEARDYYAQAEEANRRIGHDFGAAACAANRAEILVQQGRAVEARAVLIPALRALVAAKATSYITFALALLGRAEMLSGDFAAAIDHLGEARQFAETMGETDGLLSIQAAAAECLVRSGEPDEALIVIERARAQLTATPDALAAAPAVERVYGLALVATGRGAAGGEALRHALHLARERFNNYDVQECLSALLRCGAAQSPLESLAWEASQQELAASLGIVEADRDGDNTLPVAL